MIRYNTYLVHASAVAPGVIMDPVLCLAASPVPALLRRVYVATACNGMVVWPTAHGRPSSSLRQCFSIADHSFRSYSSMDSRRSATQGLPMHSIAELGVIVSRSSWQVMKPFTPCTNNQDSFLSRSVPIPAVLPAAARLNAVSLSCRVYSYLDVRDCIRLTGFTSTSTRMPSDVTRRVIQSRPGMVLLFGYVP